MLKAFFKIWFFVLIPIVLMIFIEPMNLISRLENKLTSDYFRENFKGTIFLIEEELRNLPEEQWQNQFKHITRNFGYPAQLQSIEEFKHTPELSESLMQENFILQGDESPHLFYKIPDSHLVIHLSIEEPKEVSMVKTAQGSIHLLRNQLEKIAPEKWPQRLKELRPHFGYDINIVDPGTLKSTLADLPEQKRQQLYQLGFTWIQPNDNDEFYYIYFPKTEQLIIAGTISSAGINLTMLLGVFIIFFTLISIGFLLWLKPLWRDLIRLGQATSRFGNGKLDSRATVNKNSLVNRLGSSFNTMADQIEVLINDHRNLTNALAHDLRTPLSRFRFALEMLESEDSTEQEKQRYRDSINNSLESLDYLINQMLILSRYSRAADITHFAPCDIGKLFSQEADMCQQNHPHLSVQFSTTLSCSDHMANIDQRALTRALSNLLGNAVRFAQKNIVVCLSEQDNHYALSVQDDGPGIAIEKREKVLQPFVQSGNEERATNAGHGLGLAIVNNIAQWHGGSMSIDDATLGGAKITITWPSRSA